MTSVLVCDDRPHVRERLRRAVESVPGIERVDSLGIDDAVVRRYVESQPVLVLMGSGERVSLIEDLAAEGARVVVLGMSTDRDLAVRCLTAGARGYLLEDAAPAELAATVAHAIADSTLTPIAVPAARKPAPELTERELQVLRGMSEGKSNGEIGRSLYLSEDTVKTHARRLFRKLGVGDRAQAVALGFRHGLVR